MEWIVTAGIVGFVAYRFIMMGKGGGCCGGHGSHGSSHGSHKGPDIGQKENADHDMMQDSDTAIDPVCGMEVSKKDAVKKTVNGETFYFCCGGCAKKFAG
jgi:YHS domain-containing protein